MPRLQPTDHVVCVAKSLSDARNRYGRYDPNANPVVMDLNIVREVKGSMPNVVYPHKQHTEWLDCVVPERSMTVFPRLKQEEDSMELHDWLRERETSIVPGKFFECPRHFRLGFAVQPELVAEGLRQLSEGLNFVALST